MMDWDTELSGTYQFVNTIGGPYTFHDRPMKDIIDEVCGKSRMCHVKFFITEPEKCSFTVFKGTLLGPFKE